MRKPVRRLVEEQRLVAHDTRGRGASTICAEIARSASASSSSVGGFDLRAAPGATAGWRQRRGAPPWRRPRHAGSATRRCSSSNRHHRSCEYSTCLKAKRPSHTGRARRPTGWPATQPGARRPSRRTRPVDRTRVGSRRRTRSTKRQQRRLLVVDPLQQRGHDPEDDARAPRGSRPRRAVAHTPLRERRAGPTPTRLPRKCEASSERAAAGSPISHASRPGADGVAPEKRSTRPGQEGERREEPRGHRPGQPCRAARAEPRDLRAALAAPRPRPGATRATASGQEVVDGAVERRGPAGPSSPGEVGLQERGP